MMLKVPGSVVNEFQMLKQIRSRNPLLVNKLIKLQLKHMFASEWSYMAQEITVLSLCINDNRSGRR